MGEVSGHTLIKMDYDKVKEAVKIVQKQNLNTPPYSKGYESKPMLFLKKYWTALWYLSKEAMEQIQTWIRFSESSPSQKRFCDVYSNEKLESEKRKNN